MVYILHFQREILKILKIYYIIGLEEESKKYANLLGYNYVSSEWYEKSYSVFDTIYKKNKEQNIKNKKKKTESILKKFKSLFK